MPAYKSSTRPAFSANNGSRGKIPCSYCQGLMASSCSVRHTVLLLIGLPSAFCARLVRSATDCRLIGNSVSATASQAMATIAARSTGGKSRLLAASRVVLNAEITSSPTSPPALHLPRRQPNDLGRILMADAWPFVEQQHQPKSLHILHRSRAPANGVDRVLQKSVRKDTRHRSGSTHQRPPFHSDHDSLYLPIPKVRRNHDVIYEMDHLAALAKCGNATWAA